MSYILSQPSVADLAPSTTSSKPRERRYQPHDHVTERWRDIERLRAGRPAPDRLTIPQLRGIQESAAQLGTPAAAELAVVMLERAYEHCALRRRGVVTRAELGQMANRVRKLREPQISAGRQRRAITVLEHSKLLVLMPRKGCRGERRWHMPGLLSALCDGEVPERAWEALRQRNRLRDKHKKRAKRARQRQGCPPSNVQSEHPTQDQNAEFGRLEASEALPASLSPASSQWEGANRLEAGTTPALESDSREKKEEKAPPGARQEPAKATSAEAAQRTRVPGPPDFAEATSVHGPNHKVVHVVRPQDEAPWLKYLAGADGHPSPRCA